MANKSNRDINWNRYQEAQLSTLKSLSKSFEQSLKMSQSISTSLNKVDYALTSIARELVSDVEKFDKGLKDIEDAASGFSDQLSRAGDDVERAAGRLSSAVNSMAGSIGTFIKNVADQFGGLKGLGDQANKFSEISNQMIKMSGMSGENVKDFRSELMSTVSELNKVTGNYYSPQEAYASMVSTYQNVTSDLEAIGEMSRPLLLAQESLNVNMESVAELFNRFYNRYQFSSAHMEEALNNIRTNTAGNSASAEATIENTEMLEYWINMASAGDNDKRLAIMDELSNLSSWAESMNIDSNKLAEDTNIIAGGDRTSARGKALVRILSAGGINDFSLANSMAKEGDYAPLWEAIIKGSEYYATIANSSTHTDELLEKFTADAELTKQIYQSKNSEADISYEDFKEGLSDVEYAMRSEVDDMYVSAEEAVTNTWLEKIHKRLADLQESLGFGLSDIVVAGILFREVFSSPRGAGGVGGASSRLSGLATNLWNSSASIGYTGAAATALGAVGATAGLGLGFYGGIQGIKDLQEGNKGYGTANILGGAAGVTGSIALMLGSGPVGWVALAASALTLAGTALVKEIKSTSGAADSIKDKFSNLEDALNDDAVARIADINTLKVAIDTASDAEEALELVRDSGLLPLNEGVNYTKDELLKLADEALNATSSLIAMNDAALKAASAIATEEAKEQTEDIKKELSDVFDEMLGFDDTLKRNKKGDETDYLLSKSFFEQAADSISNEESKTKYLQMVEKAFKDEELTSDEVNRLLDISGIGLGKNSRTRSFFRSMDDLDAFNAAASILGVTGYDLTENINASKLAELYNSWATTTSEYEKDKYLQEFIELYNNTSEIVRAPYSRYAEEMGIKGYATGTNYITQDQLALVHEGEAIVPKKYNPAANNAALLEAIGYLESNSEDNNQQNISYIQELIDEVKELGSFLKEWKSSNDKKNMVSSVNANRSTTSTNKSMILSYFNI